MCTWSSGFSISSTCSAQQSFNSNIWEWYCNQGSCSVCPSAGCHCHDWWFWSFSPYLYSAWNYHSTLEAMWWVLVFLMLCPLSHELWLPACPFSCLYDALISSLSIVCRAQGGSRADFTVLFPNLSFCSSTHSTPWMTIVLPSAIKI